jgi:hypothetical protein
MVYIVHHHMGRGWPERYVTKQLWSSLT